MDLVHTLLELQEHDLAIVRYNKQLDEMPEKRAILAARAKIADIAKLKERTDTVVRHMEAAVRTIEDSIAQVKTKMEAEQAKLVSGEINSPKELQAVSHELDALRRRVEHLEGQELSEMEKREGGAAQAAKIDAALAEGARREAELTERFKARGGELLAHIKAEQAARDKLFATLPADAAAKYGALQDAHPGSALGVLSGGMCSACRVGLPSTKVQKLEEGPDVALCPNCGRILIVRGA